MDAVVAITTVYRTRGRRVYRDEVVFRASVDGIATCEPYFDVVRTVAALNSNLRSLKAVGVPFVGCTKVEIIIAGIAR